MNPAMLQQFLSVALPIMVTLVATIWIAQWSRNKRFDDLNKRFDDLKSDMNRRFDEIIKRLERIEGKLDDHEERIVRLEERTSPVRRG
jgi:predicted nuclease with TOPRIM domain